LFRKLLKSFVFRYQGIGAMDFEVFGVRDAVVGEHRCRRGV
jgi:hypothetical protein